MDDDHVRADELLVPGDPVPDDHPVVDHELEVQARHQRAGVALAGRCLGDVAQAAPEGEVCPLDRVEELRAVDTRSERIGEGGIALKLGQPKAWPEGIDHGRDQVGQDVLGVIQLGARQVARVAGDVGNQQARRLGLGEHAPSPMVSGPSRESGEVRKRTLVGSLAASEMWFFYQGAAGKHTQLILDITGYFE